MGNVSDVVFFCVQVTQVASVSIGGDGKDADVYVPCVADGLLGLTTDKGSNNVNKVTTDKAVSYTHLTLPTKRRV